MRTVLGTLMLLALTALIAAGVPVEPQAPATAGTDTTSQELAKPSAKAPASRSARKIPCKTSENASLCYWTHGRLSYYSVNFTWLLWKIGTHRLLKICDEPTYLSLQSTADCADPEFPVNLEHVYDVRWRHWKRTAGHGEYPPLMSSLILKFAR